MRVAHETTAARWVQRLEAVVVCTDSRRDKSQPRTLKEHRTQSVWTHTQVRAAGESGNQQRRLTEQAHFVHAAHVCVRQHRAARIPCAGRTPRSRVSTTPRGWQRTRSGGGGETRTERLEHKSTLRAADVGSAGVPIGGARARPIGAARLAVRVPLDLHELTEHDRDGARIIGRHVLRAQTVATGVVVVVVVRGHSRTWGNVARGGERTRARKGPLRHEMGEERR